MKTNHPLPSPELNDRLLQSYEHLVYLLGQDVAGEEHYSGQYDRIDVICSGVIEGYTSIPNILNDKVNSLLKFDYIYRKHFHQINKE